MQAAETLESIVLRDCGRGIELLGPYTRGSLEVAARALCDATSAAVVTGFAVPTPGGVAPETDGPIGAAALAAYLLATGRRCCLITDRINEPVCRASLNAYGVDAEVLTAETSDDVPSVASTVSTRPVDVVVFIERLGPNDEGQYLSMGGVDMTAATPPLDQLARIGIHSIGIGDGGNEIGMGRLPRAAVADAIPNGSRIHCVTPTDELVLAGVSNWGGWALVGAAAALSGHERNADEALSIGLFHRALKQAVAAGAVDGVRLQHVESVDGMDPILHDAVLTAIRTIAGL